LPTNVFNKYGYNIEFDAEGNFEDYRIDFEALGAHIVALHKAALQRGFDLWRVIFDPRLQEKLFATNYGGYIKQHINIPTKKSWVRHDDHYHVDFSMDCQPME
jgi:penicillin-insensitive murein endopeptidase